MKKQILSILINATLTMSAWAMTEVNSFDQTYDQSIQVVNLLANTSLPDFGMTKTPIIVKFYNGGSTPCWMSTLNFKEDTTVHAGRYLGCVDKVSEVVILANPVANVLHTYEPEMHIPIDITRFSNQITILSSDTPLFDTLSGLVIKPGRMMYKLQYSFKKI